MQSVWPLTETIVNLILKEIDNVTYLSLPDALYNLCACGCAEKWEAQLGRVWQD